ncbi:hypothetical protein SESBI_23265 [Sesbania bispinosa]|nr:hypothetical protein SESBI_23265 [Sesbania bispinosa]
MGDKLVGVVLEAEEVVAVLVDGGDELVLDAFPGSEEERRKCGQWWEGSGVEGLPDPVELGGIDHLPLFCSNSLEVKWELRMDDEEDEGEWMHKHVDDG